MIATTERPHTAPTTAARRVRGDPRRFDMVTNCLTVQVSSAVDQLNRLAPVELAKRAGLDPAKVTLPAAEVLDEVREMLCESAADNERIDAAEIAWVVEEALRDRDGLSGMYAALLALASSLVADIHQARDEECPTCRGYGEVDLEFEDDRGRSRDYTVACGCGA